MHHSQPLRLGLPRGAPNGDRRGYAEMPIGLGTPTGIAARRLHTQRLTGEPFASAVDAVAWLAAVQAQDYTGAKWALGQRTRGATEADLDRLFDEGAILRTHVLRPTWHFVLPDDIRWLLELTGPRITRALAGRHRELELDAKVVARAGAAFAKALAGGRQLTPPPPRGGRAQAG